MIPLPGFVYIDHNFKFANGSSKPKYFVVLTQSSKDKDALIVAITTSKTKSNNVYGCFHNQYPPCFYLPTEKHCLESESWVLFDEVYTYTYDVLKRWDRVCELNLSVLADMLECASQSDHIENWIKTDVLADSKAIRKANP